MLVEALLSPSIEVKECQETMGPPEDFFLKTLEYTWRGVELYGAERGRAESAESPASTIFIVHGEIERIRNQQSAIEYAPPLYNKPVACGPLTFEFEARSFSLAMI